MTIPAFSSNRWKIAGDGRLVWNISDSTLPHSDFIESSGAKISVILDYGVNESGRLSLRRKCVWPMLRMVPNNTHASLIREYGLDINELVNINDVHGSDGRTLKDDTVDSVRLGGVVEIFSHAGDKLRIYRQLFPSTDKPVWNEIYTLTNISYKNIKIDIPKIYIENLTNPADGTDGGYRTLIASSGHGYYVLAPGESVTFNLTVQSLRDGEEPLETDSGEELEKRLGFIMQINENLVLNTPDTILNTMFSFAKIRAAESIFETAGGPMHGPGGGDYYAAIWANDQAEYINPFFPFLGYGLGNESAVNSFRHFARFMNDGYDPLPSSVIAEGKDVWAGAGDRGDAAMIAYGAARFALAYGDRSVAEELWPLIEWTLEYNRRHLNEAGVVMSDSDELEGRFPSGDANLCTSSLYYDALLSASYLADGMELPSSVGTEYRRQASDLKKEISDYFEADVEGYSTYRYYDGNDILRSWICIPLTVGIYDRTKGTVDALFSDRLWTEDGLATQAGDVTFWDRSTLYALRGIMAAGETERAMDYIKKYSERRLLGDHVPYAVEAYPEGGQRQLSAESGLYCRIFTEGLFGIRPKGLDSFSITPRMPDGWSEMELRRIRAFGKDFDVEVKRHKDKLKVTVRENNGGIVVDKRIKPGETLMVNF